jgi:hypothetical protein
LRRIREHRFEFLEVLVVGLMIYLCDDLFVPVNGKNSGFASCADLSGEVQGDDLPGCFPSDLHVLLHAMG